MEYFRSPLSAFLEESVQLLIIKKSLRLGSLMAISLLNKLRCAWKEVSWTFSDFQAKSQVILGNLFNEVETVRVGYLENKSVKLYTVINGCRNNCKYSSTFSITRDLTVLRGENL